MSAPVVAAGAPVVSVRGVRKSFGATRALQGVDLDVAAGEIVGLVGDNGAGKSTLIKILSGFIRPDTGTIEVDGEPVRLRSPRDARRIGIETVYQEQALADDMTVAANLFLGTELRRGTWPFRLLDVSTMERRAQEMLDELRLRAAPRQETRFCSGGEKQGIAIARAIHVNARVVILDEPTNALGVVAVDRVLELILELKKRGIGCIFVSHNIEHIIEVCDRVAVFVHGTKIVDVPKAETTVLEIVDLLNQRSGHRI